MMRALALSLLLALTACGGGGDQLEEQPANDGPPSNTQPVNCTNGPCR